jgi:hypothetical protein
MKFSIIAQWSSATCPLVSRSLSWFKSSQTLAPLSASSFLLKISP